MITIEEALFILKSQIIPLEAEEINLSEALNRILAQDVLSDTDMPPFDKAAMDGYACQKKDIFHELEIIEEIPAGKIPVKIIGDCQCSRIMTGAMVPKGADFILMKEHSRETLPGKILCTKETNNINICYKGEDVKAGDIIMRKGGYLKPQHIAVLASTGVIKPSVYKLPEIAIISTGNELVEPNCKPGIAQIRNSNGIQVLTQGIQMGLKPHYLGIIPDDEAALKEIISTSINKYDVILISGGVSVGNYDYVPHILMQSGVDILFHGVNAKPGRHLLFGRKGNHFVFGLPGNPVSSFVQFEILVKAFLYKFMGTDFHPLTLQLTLEENYFRKKNDIIGYIPVNITENSTAIPLEYHGSAHIHAYTSAIGIMEIPLGKNEIKKGEAVRVRPL